MKIAVIGSGISGLSAAYYLSKKYKVDLFEREDHFGGHSYTYDINENDKKVPVDLGFIVFNKLTYPNLINFFNELEVPYEKSDMSFSVSVKDSTIEYGGTGFNALFARKNNLFNFNFIKMIYEIISFYKTAPILLKKDLKNLTLGNYLDNSKLSKYFINYHIVPMVAAIWSMPPYEAKQMPLNFFINFFKNHGLFNLKNRPQWKYVKGGSKTYIEKVIALNLFKYSTNISINYVDRKNNKIEIFQKNNEKLIFDKIVFATHADQALSLIKNPTKEETDVLTNFKYSKNNAYLHSDVDLMPKNTKTWSSWNFLDHSQSLNFTLTYWMNNLQKLKTSNNYFVTINPPFEPKNIWDKTIFEHPIFNLSTYEAQQKLHNLQGKLNTFFCGSYFGYGFHEDGIQSSALVANLMGVNLPWTRDKKFINRLQFDI